MSLVNSILDTVLGIDHLTVVPSIMNKLRYAFQNDHGYVPAYYLFDADGKLRSFAAGERGVDMLKAALERILAQASQAAAT